MKWVVKYPQKLVPFLQEHLGEYSGKFIRKLLQANLCQINGRLERFGSRVLQKGEIVEFEKKWNIETNSKQIEVIYDDSDLQIVNKPAGLESSSKNLNHILVHRLDKQTSGLLILAKTEKAKQGMIELFRQRKVQKRYLALVDGNAPSQGTRKSFFVKKSSFQGQSIWGSHPDRGVEAITQFKCLGSGKNASLLLCMPITGRTHQIRVHMAEMGHPILIDAQYAKTYRCSLVSHRPLLHAFQLEFEFEGKQIQARSPLSDDFSQALLWCGIDFMEYV